MEALSVFGLFGNSFEDQRKYAVKLLKKKKENEKKFQYIKNLNSWPRRMTYSWEHNFMLEKIPGNVQKVSQEFYQRFRRILLKIPGKFNKDSGDCFSRRKPKLHEIYTRHIQMIQLLTCEMRKIFGDSSKCLLMTLNQKVRY